MCVCISIYCKTYYNSRIANCSVGRAQVVWWPQPKPLWSNGPRHIGYCRKALVIVRTILTLYWGQNAGILEKEGKVIHIVPRTADYLRFMAFLVSGSYAPVVLMPHLLWQSFATLISDRTKIVHQVPSRKENDAHHAWPWVTLPNLRFIHCANGVTVLLETCSECNFHCSISSIEHFTPLKKGKHASNLKTTCPALLRAPTW